MADDHDHHAPPSASGKAKNHNKYRRDKPWDSESIDHWQIDHWDEEKGDKLPGGRLLEESSFATLFPKYRETYLRQVWPVVTRALDGVKIACELNLVEGSMTVRTTKQTSDPYVILKARDLLKLLARSIPVAQALKILDDEWHCDIVKIGGLVRNKQRFVKRRQRLLGPDGSTLKALELLTSCYILVQGNTVSIMGSSHVGLKQARQVVLDCMNNIHPVYNIKRLMIQKELSKDPKLAKEDWSRFLPKFQKKNVPRRKPTKSKQKQQAQTKQYTPFPPPQQPRKVDLQLDTGEYFVSEGERKAKKLAARQQKATAKSRQKQEARLQEFVAPTNKTGDNVDQMKSSTKGKSGTTTSTNVNVNVEALKAKFGKAKRGRDDKHESPASQVSDFVDDAATAAPLSKKKRRVQS